MKIQSQPPKLGTLAQKLAARVAGIHFPTTANSVFDKMRQAQLAMYGDYGLAMDPRTKFKSGGGFTTMEDPTTTDILRKKQLGGISLPDMTQFDNEDTANGNGYVSGKNSKYVDDQGWGVTLQQILGSRMLSQEQLRAASIQNVSSLFRVEGARSEEEKQEIYFMFQRMMLEGFVRGVDITRDIQRQGGTKVVITDGAVPNATNGNVIGKSTQGGVYLRGSFWRSKDDASKLALFYHEMGHELLNKGHEGSGMMKSGGGGITARTLKSGRQAYDAYMNDFFDASNSRGIDHLRTPVVKNVDPVYDPSWYPSVTGVDKGYMPGSTGATQQPINQTIINNSYQPVTQAGSTIKSSLPEGTARIQAPQQTMQAPQGANSQEDTMTAPDSFSANLQTMAQSGVQTPALQGIAGNITNKAG